MTPREILFSWGLAGMCLLAFVATISTSTSAYTASCPVYQARGLDAGTIVIGSSLALYAFATDPDEAGPLADVTVWSIPGIGLDHSLHLLRCAAETNVGNILVEANTFAFGENVLTDFTNQVRSIIRQTLLGEVYRVDPGIGATASALRNHDWDGTRPAARSGPWVPIQSAWVETLHDIGVSHPGRIFLFEPPRTALQFNDISPSFDPQETLSALADGASLPLITVGLVWEPSNFIDYHSHLNARGRVRFQHEFAAAWQVVSDAH
ncbi:MAG: hypothetical protein WAO78_10995 [Roseovarius sp.]